MNTLTSVGIRKKQRHAGKKRLTAVHVVEQLEVRELLAADVLAEVRVMTDHSLSASFADLPGLTTTITLTETTTFRLESTLNMNSTENTSFNGQVRFAIDGTGELVFFSFDNPYVLPTLSGTTADTVVSVDPPPVTTSESDAGGTHSHAVNIPAFDAEAHNHSFSLDPVASTRNWSVDAHQWVTLGPGTHTITVQGAVNADVVLEGLQTMTVTQFESGPIPDVANDYVYNYALTALTSEFADIGTVSRTITLTENTIIYLDADLGLKSSSNSSFSGEVRFAVDGTGLDVAATFDNPYRLPPLTGMTNTVSATINPPETTTSSDGSPSHNHTFDIGNFGTTSHDHNVNVLPAESQRTWIVGASDWITLGPGTHTITLQAKVDADVSLNFLAGFSYAAFSPQAIPGVDYVEVDTTTSTAVAAAFADVPGLTRSFDLTQETVVYLGSQLNMATTSNASFTGQVRFAVNGTGELPVAVFGNPYQLPPLSAMSSVETFGVDPPSRRTSTDGADAGHSHSADIAEFQSNPHAHSISVTPSTSRRTWDVEASDWIVLGPGSYTITVQAQTNGTVVFDADQSLDVVLIPTKAPPSAAIDSISGLRVVGKEITVNASATDTDDALDQLEYTYRVYVDGELTPSFEGSGVDLTQFKFTPTTVGSYLIELTVTDPGGLFDVVEQTISVGPASLLDLIFSRSAYAVGDVDTDGLPDQPDTFHEWEDAKAQLWITIQEDLPSTPFNLFVNIDLGNTWLGIPETESHITSSYTGSLQPNNDRFYISTFFDLDLSGYETGDRVLLATIVFPPDVDDGVGIPIQGSGAYETATSAHEVSLYHAEDRQTKQPIAFTEQVPGNFVPVIYDADDSGHVGIGDFAHFIAQYGKVPSVTNPDGYLFDYDRNGRVGIGDFALFIRQYGLRKPSGTREIEMPGLNTPPPPIQPVLAIEAESITSDEALLTQVPIVPNDIAPSSTSESFTSRTSVSYGPVESSSTDYPQSYAQFDVDPRVIDAAHACEYLDTKEEMEELDDAEELFAFFE